MNLWAEWAVTSSVLILIVVLLRAVLGKRLRAGVRYVLWGLVLLRLLVPVQLFAVPVLDADIVEAPGQQEPSEREPVDPGPSLGGETPDTTRPGVSGTVSPGNPSTLPQDSLPGERPGNTQTPAPGGDRDNTQTGERDPDPGVAPEPDVDPVDTSGREPVKLGTLLLWIWLGGAIATGLILLHVNLHFAVTLRRERGLLKGAECRLPVYVLEGLRSPCLFGVFRPAVYLSPEAAEDPRMLRHVLFHEETHYRHGDHIWSLLRCAALAVHWWNPLVWLAVSLSRRDGELFCDEGALKKLGDGERKAYGNTLLTLVTAGPSASALMSCATTMSGGKKALRERISRIAIPVKRHAWAVALVLTVAVVAAACAFIDPVEKPSDVPTDDPTDATEPTDPTEPEDPTDTPDPTERPYRVPGLYPAAEPYNVLSVRDLEPYAPPEVTNTGSFDGTTVVDSVTIGGNVTVLLENDRRQRAVAVKDGEEQRVFMTGLSQNAKITAFHDVLGFDGVRVYDNPVVYDYFRFTDTGEPVLILESNPSALSGSPEARDIDGDGIREVVDGGKVFIFRDGVIYFVKIDQLLNDIEDDNKDVGALIYDGGMVIHCYATPKGADSSRYYTRYVSFDGENLCVYKEDKPWHDHVVDGVGEGIPSEVMAAARDYVEKETIVQNPDGTYSEWDSYSQSAYSDALYDDWRIESMRLDWQQPRDEGWTVEGYYFDYGLHTITPEKVVLAGARVLTEDDWFIDIGQMLVYKNEGGKRTLLWIDTSAEQIPGGEYFQEYLDNHLAELGLNPTYPMTPNRPAVPTVFPEGEPERVLSLAGLEPYTPPKVTNTGSFQGTVVDSVYVQGHTVVLLENDQGERAVAVKEGDEQRVFMTGLDRYDEIEAFEGIFGMDGVRVYHYLQPIYDYFRFTKTGEPMLMLRTEVWSGEPVIVDFDGDGIDELADRNEFFFLRDGALYRADIETILNDKESLYIGGACRAGDRCVEWIYSVEYIKNFSSRTYTRLIYFDGENLRVYKEDKTWHDHVVDGVGEGIPSEVMAAARDYVEKEATVQNPDGTYSVWNAYSQSVIGDALYDDWRIENFSLDWQQLRDGGWTVEVYYFNYELHTITPEKVGLAGSMYLTEDDWVCPTSPGCEVLFFKNEGGVRTFLWHDMINDISPGTPEFQEYIDASVEEMGLGSADPYEEIRNSTLDILYSNTKEYKYVYNGAKKGDEAAKEAALKMAERFMEDLTTTDELTFRVTEYRNLDVRLRPTLELVANGGMNGKDEYLYKYTLLDSEVGEDRWIVKLYVEFRYEGWMDRYGIAPTRQMYEEEDGWFNTLAGYVNNQVWFLLTRDGNTYTMRSRLDALKEANLYKPYGLAPLPYYDPDDPRDVRLYLDIQYRESAVAYDNMNIYRYVYHGTKEGDDAAEEAALAMAEMFLDDLLNADDVPFRITQYRNPGVRIISTIEQAETLTGPDGTRIDGFEDLLDGEVGPDKWLVYLYADYRYEWWNDEDWQGTVGWPTSQEEFEEKNFWFNGFIQGENQIGCFMYRVGDTFVMQSRMGKMIEIGDFAPLKVNQ